MSAPHKILMVAAEATPLIKVGGLADVVGALPKALTALGHDVRIMLPLYGSIDRQRLRAQVASTHAVRFGGQQLTVSVFEASLPGSSVPLYLIECPAYFGENGPYLMGHGTDIQRRGLQRFVAFSSFVAQILPGLKWEPDVVHCHDWMAGLVPIALAINSFPRPTMLTIHNLHNQGVWNAAEVLTWLGWSGTEHPALRLRDHRGDLNVLQLAIQSSTIVNTVSPTYAQEIVTPEYGEGLDSDLAIHQPPLVGILNGLDTEQFNPATDLALERTYDIRSVGSGKPVNKQALQRQLGLAPASTAPLFVAVSRLSPQKGFDLLPPVVDELVRSGGQVAILGSGWPEIEGQLHRLADTHPRSVAVRLGFDAALAQRLYAGADFFLMPSRFEPCGLGQMISMRYGTLPIVRDTGGLHDTVIDLTADPARGTGFVFPRFAVEDFRVALQSALRLYRRPATLQAAMTRAMTQDFSWTRSAEAYLRFYAQA